MKTFIFQLFRAAYTIVCVLFAFSMITLSMLNYNALMSELTFWALYGVLIVAIYGLYKLWEIEINNDEQEEID